MYRNVNLKLKTSVSVMLVIAFFAPMIRTQMPSKEEKPLIRMQTPGKDEKPPIKASDEINELLRSVDRLSTSKQHREKINDKLRAAGESMRNRRHPQIRSGTGVGPLRQAVAPRQVTPFPAKPNACGQNAPAHTIVVSSTADDGPDSLRHALAVACVGDTINITA